MEVPNRKASAISFETEVAIRKLRTKQICNERSENLIKELYSLWNGSSEVKVLKQSCCIQNYEKDVLTHKLRNKSYESKPYSNTMHEADF